MSRKKPPRRALRLVLVLAIGATTVGSTVAGSQSSTARRDEHDLEVVTREIANERRQRQDVIDHSRTETEALEGIRQFEWFKSQSERRIQDAQLRQLRADGHADAAARLEREIAENGWSLVVDGEDGGER